MRTPDVRRQTSDLRLRTSDFGLRTSDLGLQAPAGLRGLKFEVRRSMWGQPPSAVRSSEARQKWRQSQKCEVRSPRSEVRSRLCLFHSSSAVMKNSCDELSYST